MKKSQKNSNGITLVALVITIIVLLILAGISISVLTNQGLFTQAQNAKKLTDEKMAEENEILINYLEQMNAIIGGQLTESVPDGAVVTPINDITTWLKTAGISKQYSYTTIEQVIVDSTCTESLMNNENAMKYLARSTEFADAICESEMAMTYLGDSAYVDDTMLNSDFAQYDVWVNKLTSSLYADKVFPIFTVHGGAYETIIVDGTSISFSTNSDGTCTHALPLGEITLTGSVSGKSFTRNVTKETTDVYVMPEGALYWYGNECTDITGGWVLGANNQNQGSSLSDAEKQANRLYFKSSSSYGYRHYSTKNPISTNSNQTLKMISESTVCAIGPLLLRSNGNVDNTYVQSFSAAMDSARSSSNDIYEGSQKITVSGSYILDLMFGGFDGRQGSVYAIVIQL